MKILNSIFLAIGIAISPSVTVASEVYAFICQSEGISPFLMKLVVEDENNTKNWVFQTMQQ